MFTVTNKTSMNMDAGHTSQSQKEGACLSGLAQGLLVKTCKYFVQNVVGQVREANKICTSVRTLICTSHTQVPPVV